MRKKIIVSIASLVLLAATVFSGETMIHAAGTSPGMNARGGVEEEEGEIIDSEVTEVTVRAGFDKEGYYPATLQYAINRFQILLKFENGSNILLGQYSGWYEETSWENGEEAATGSYKTSNDWINIFYMRFYDANGEQVLITDSSVPVGEYTVKISRFVDGVEKIVWTSPDKLIVKDPADRIQESKQNTAYYNSSTAKYEESWYPVSDSVEIEKEYIYSASEFSNQYWFASIWTYEAGVATRINKGIRADQSEVPPFGQVYSDLSNTYLVIGDTSTYEKQNEGSVSWNVKKEISSISLSPETSYEMWTSDYMQIPVTVTYTDGTRETYTNWSDDGAYMYYIGEDGRTWGGDNGLKLTTANNDVICIAMKNTDGQWVKSYSSKYWKPGTTKWTAYVEKDSESYKNPEIYTNVTWNVVKPTIQKLDYTSEIATNFNVTANKEAYYSYEVPKADKQIEIANYSAEDTMSFYVFKRELGTENPWSRKTSAYLGASETRKYTDCEDGYEYLFVLETSKANAGSIGIYVSNAKTKSAVIETSTVDLEKGWNAIPITVSFVGTDGETVIGTQTIQSWSGTDDSAALYAKTKYKETLYCALYQGDKQVSIFASDSGDSLDELLLQYFGVTSAQLSQKRLEEYKAVLREMGKDWSTGESTGSQVEAGTYTLKVYKDSISADNVIGSKKITVADGSLKKLDSATLKYTSYTYNGSKKTPVVLLNGKTLKKDTDYTVSGTASATKAGTYKITIKGKGNYTGTKTFTYKINAKSVAGASLKYKTFTYSGSKKTPTIIVDGRTLTKNTDYTISSGTASTAKVGRYYIKITGKGNYKGTTEKIYYTIVPKKVAELTGIRYQYGNQIKVTWKKSTGATGYKVEWKKTSGSYSSKNKTTRGSGYNYYIRSGLSADTSYTFRVTPYYKSGSGNYYYGSAATYTIKTAAKGSKLVQVKTPSVSKKSGSSVTVKWTNVSGESGYQISRSTSSTGTNIVNKVSGSSVKSKVVTAKKGTGYYYKVRAYRVVGGKYIYGAWSSTKYYKIK